MSFTGEGFAPFPNVYEDNKRVAAISDLSDEVIASRVSDYWLFLQREDIMPRARLAAERILTHLNFEMDYRTDYFAIQKLEAAL